MINGDPLLRKNPDGTQSDALANKFDSRGVLSKGQAKHKEYALTAMALERIRNRLDPLIEKGALRSLPLERRLQDAHRQIFRDVYDWAGKYREVNVAKRDAQSRSVTKFEYIASLGLDPSKLTAEDRSSAQIEFRDLIGAIEKWDLAVSIVAGDHKAMAKHFAEFATRLNHLHAFREGNGRTNREVVRQVALERGYDFRLSKTLEEAWTPASIAAAKGDMSRMEAVMNAALEPRARAISTDRATVERLFSQTMTACREADLRCGLPTQEQVAKMFSEVKIEAMAADKQMGREPGREMRMERSYS